MLRRKKNMTDKTAALNDSVFVRYLLGEVSDGERAELEEKYFADDEFFEQLVEAQNDLVDAYLAGSLTAAERKRFEERFLTTNAASESVKFADALRHMVAVQRVEPVRRSRFDMRTLAIAASAAFIFILTGWLVISSQRRETSATGPRPTIARQERRPAPVPDRSTPPPQSSPVREAPLVTLLLTPGSTRDSDATQPLELRAAPQFVRLELVLEENRFESYKAELQDVEGRRLFEETSLSPEAGRSGRMIVMRVPAKLLPPGDYIVLLYGIRNGSAREVSNYTFTVVARAARRSP
jgi:hypothetical protein